MLRFFRNLRRRRLLKNPFPQSWDAILQRHSHFFEGLNVEQSARLKQNIQIFVAEKNWEGCGGFELTEESQVIIAAIACLMVLEVQPVTLFEHVLSILIYPTAYRAQSNQTSPAGVVNESGQVRLGEAWWQGPVILSWQDVQRDVGPGYAGGNLVIHEFAHQLDMMNGRHVDGQPVMNSREQSQRWAEVLRPAYQTLVRQCRTGRPGIIDCYGATSPAEFFAVVSECFFSRSQLLNDHHPDLYAVLLDYYGLDTAAWRE